MRTHAGGRFKGLSISLKKIPVMWTGWDSGEGQSRFAMLRVEGAGECFWLEWLGWWQCC